MYVIIVYKGRYQLCVSTRKKESENTFSFLRPVPARMFPASFDLSLFLSLKVLNFKKKV